jgi:hypothetical protein
MYPDQENQAYIKIKATARGRYFLDFAPATVDTRPVSTSAGDARHLEPGLL